ncbi:MAG: glycerophosphodiester phosphodiesterase [Hyphomicrobiales bacterium]|nr:glycerophosphodiester phosphodiesterase [Hyphomicrobiales bacterium]
MTSKHDWLSARPIAHRGLHNSDNNICENTLSACKAALIRNFSIEVDLHLARDGVPVVFHDRTLERMCNDRRKVRELDSTELRNITIGSSSDYIAPLSELLELIDGKTGLILELKGIVNEDAGFVESVAQCLVDYQGPVALMSFNHWILKDARQLAPQLTLGLVAEGSERRYSGHWAIAKECEVDFVTYDQNDLPNKFCEEFRATGKPLLCWTIKDAERMKRSLNYVDQITFEQFDPDNI